MCIVRESADRFCLDKQQIFMAVLHAYAHLKFVETFRAFNDSFAAEDKTLQGRGEIMEWETNGEMSLR